MRRRTNSQKPNEELIENFKAAFPHVASTTRSQSIGNPSGPSLTDALDVAQHNARYVDCSRALRAPCRLVTAQAGSLLCTYSDATVGDGMPFAQSSPMTPYEH
jgi:hypothetical protein